MGRRIPPQKAPSWCSTLPAEAYLRRAWTGDHQGRAGASPPASGGLGPRAGGRSAIRRRSPGGSVRRNAGKHQIAHEPRLRRPGAGGHEGGQLAIQPGRRDAGGQIEPGVVCRVSWQFSPAPRRWVDPGKSRPRQLDVTPYSQNRQGHSRPDHPNARAQSGRPPGGPPTALQSPLHLLPSPSAAAARASPAAKCRDPRQPTPRAV